nr:MAG TPA: hypothetical protein [Caudoviricetes sp.]
MCSFLLLHHLVHHLLHQLIKILHQIMISYDNLILSQSRINTVFTAFSKSQITFYHGMFLRLHPAAVPL